jgi:outer membrane protein OmpA-like peptidoglycan-associated protein
MLIALPNDVLFDSGKTAITPDGQAALAQVAHALATAEHRAQNRRIETVLQPNLSDLPSLEGISAGS